jgi:hypothetical protein
MSLTKRWSEADCLSRIMLSHAPRQATVSLALSVRHVEPQAKGALASVPFTEVKRY